MPIRLPPPKSRPGPIISRAHTHGPEDLPAVQILAALLSPAFPVGAYSYSHGLEWAVEAKDVCDKDGLQAWIAGIVEFGSGRNDAILLRAALLTDDPAPIAELAVAMCASSERLLETQAQGRAFARTVSAAWGVAIPPMPYPVAVGATARALGLPADATITLYLQAFTAALVSAGVRLIPLGQTDGQRIVSALLPLAAQVAERSRSEGLDDLGGLTPRADLASMLHETQYTRLYRT